MDSEGESEIEITGRMVRQECGTAIPHARIELASVANDELERQTRTDREGAFVFGFRGKRATLARKHLASLTLRITDAKGGVASTYSVTNENHRELVIALDDVQLAGAGLRVKEQRPLVRADYAPTLQAAVTRLPEADRRGALAVIERLTCGLPPVLLDPEVLDIARGVLRGRVDDLRRFDELLGRIDVWSSAVGVVVPHRGPAEVEGLMKALVAAPVVHERHRHDRGMSSIDDRVTLLAAAGAAAADDVAFVRNIELIGAQLAIGDRLMGVLDGARDAIDGSPQSFRMNIAAFGGCFPGGGHPLPFPPDFGGGFPWPMPGPFPWPTPRGPGIPSIRECDGEGIARALREALERRQQYAIESIEPPNACPGQTITIRGRDLVFEGEDTAVWFTGERRGMPIRAVATSSTANEIVVVVPEGARCGPLELEGGARSMLRVCDLEVELFSGPVTPFEFEGGETFIQRFQHTGAHCPKTGDAITFSWELCNAEEHTLTLVKREAGHVESVRPPLASRQDHYRHILAAGRLDYEFEAILEARGPCGSDRRSVRFGVQRRYRRAGDSPFVGDEFRNWHGNIRRPVRSSTPTTLQELVEAVLAAEREGAKVGTMGSGWSFTDCVVPTGTTRMIDSSALDARITHVLPQVLRDSLGLVFPAALDSILTSMTSGTPLPVVSRLVHVEAGIKVHALNRLLDLEPVPLAMPTLGGSNGQSIAGAFSTGTHGANPGLPPIADFVRAIHLVGPGGQQWWLEPASRPITDPARMQSAKLRGVLDPCLKVVYEDDLFFACLVSMGCAGVIYAVVLEAAPAHRLSTTTLPPMPWASARPLIESTLVTPTGPLPWFSEIVLNASRATWITTRTPVPLTAPLDADGCAAPDNTLRDTLLAFLIGSAVVAGPAGVIGLGSGAIGALLGALPFYIARRTAELSLMPWRWGELVEEIEFIERMMTLLNDLARIIAREGDEAVVADAIPNIFNVLWQMGLYVVDGRTLVEQAQNLFTTVGQRPPGTKVYKSYTAMTGQCDVTLPTYRPPAAHGAFERLVESYELGLPASGTLRFVDDLLRAADPIRASNDALILNFAIRFTAATGALIGMQQAPLTGHVELFTIRGMAGNAAMHPEIEHIARAHGAVPHWGQFHETLTDYTAILPRLGDWRAAMDRIAQESARDAGGVASTFRQQFALDRGLLAPL